MVDNKINNVNIYNTRILEEEKKTNYITLSGSLSVQWGYLSGLSSNVVVFFIRRSTTDMCYVKWGK